MDRYAARICWNTKGWVAPSGDASQLEHGSGTDKTWVTRTGYGHEEWLFNYQWVLDGWKYGYMRPVQKSSGGMAGQKIDVRLYTIGAKSWFYVGRIAPCHVLNDDEAHEASNEFRKRGWLGQMKDQARAIGGDARKLDEFPMFCLKFRPADAEIGNDRRKAPRFDRGPGGRFGDAA